MMTYWNNLNERERWTLLIGAACTIFYLFYLFLYSPLTNAVNNKVKQLTEKQNTLIWMQTLRSQPKNHKTPQSITNSKLLTLIASQLNVDTLKKYPYQLQQTSTGDIQLSYDQVPFNSFLQWLWKLGTDYTITIKQLNAERTDTPGVVKLMVIIAAQ